MAARKKKNAVDLPSQADPRAPLDGALLLSKAQGLLGELEADLLARARGAAPVREALRLRHEAERAARRTADPLEVWERHFVTQVAASWLLSCVFVRTLEDRGLLGHNRIAGPGATDSQRLFFELAPSLTEREYLLTVFRELSRLPAAGDLFDARHNPVWMLGPSAELAKKLLALFRGPNADAPGLRFGQSDTRFLGDLYQDLSADVRERFALLQTPHFVEKYILDRTLEPAITRFGLDETTLIDPTCGSGHFLLGAFERLVDHRLRSEPGLDLREAARRAIDAVYGADINPYAVAIARFRLTLAFLEKAGYARLADAPALPLHLVVADSLLHNSQHAQAKLGEVTGQSMSAWGGAQFALEDEAAARDVLCRRFAAVVGNPPFIAVSDPVLRERYRENYVAAAGKYTLSAPFVERFFQLARPAGLVGLLNSNAFLRRAFGKALIQEYLPTVNITQIINSAGAYIGPSVQLVILFGTHEAPNGDEITCVLSKRGEPSVPDHPENGLVWRSIVEHDLDVGFENDFISVARVSRATLERHPWSLGGGGAAELKERLEERAACRLSDLAAHIGIAAVTGEDDVYLLPASAAARLGIERTRVMVIGEEIRDWAVADSQVCLFPYDDDLQLEPIDRFPKMAQLLWRVRGVISRRKRFGTPMLERGLTWYELQELYVEKLRTPLAITFAEVASHNHFVLDRGGSLFKQTAPVIKLKESADERDHLALLAYLNSATACFWLKQVAHQFGTSSHDIDKVKGRPETNRFSFSAGTIGPLPVPALDTAAKERLAALAEEALRLAAARSSLARRCADLVRSTTVDLAAIRAEDDHHRARLVVLQEEIDWEVYACFRLVERGDGNRVERAPAGLRPFLRASVHEAWRERREQIDARPDVALIEDAVYKRAWLGLQGVFGHSRRSIDQELNDALQERARTVVEETLTRLPATVISRKALLERARLGPGVDALFRLTEELATVDVPVVCVAEAVPFLAAYRHTEAGLEKRSEWERAWDLQRAEDRGEKVPPLDPPPKYDQKDYRDATCWRLRGKLDVPKERFISYPGCESDEDKEPVYGWAGWNHLQQAQALAALYQKRKTEETWGKERLTPILAGLLELIPWVKQWHNEPSADFGGLRLGDYFETFLDGECHALGLTRGDVRAWRPAEKAKGKKAAERKARAEALDAEPDGDAPAPKPRGRKKKTVTEATET